MRVLVCILLLCDASSHVLASPTLVTSCPPDSSANVLLALRKMERAKEMADVADLPYLVKRFRNGDTSAFKEIDQLVRGPLIGFFKSRGIKNTHDQEDLLQEVYLTLTNLQKTLPDDVHPMAVIFRIAEFRRVDFLRKRGRRLRPQSLDALSRDEDGNMADNIRGSSTSPDALIVQLDESARLSQALVEGIAYLPKQQRQILDYMLFGDLKQEQIKDILGLEKPQQVANIFSQTKQKLARQASLYLGLEEAPALTELELGAWSFQEQLKKTDAAMDRYRMALRDRYVDLEANERAALALLSSKENTDSFNGAVTSGLQKLAIVPIPPEISRFHPGIERFLQSDAWNSQFDRP